MSEVVVISNFINGQFVPGENFIDSFNPATAKVFAKVPDSDGRDVQEAVQAAKDAFPEWSSRTAAERSQLLLKVADLLESRVEEFAVAETNDQGKPLWLSRAVEIPRAVTNFRHFANTILCDKDMCVNQPQDGVLNYTVHTPRGVAAIVVPWNLPLYLLSFKLAPALAYGNTVVAKPSEFTSVTAYMLCSVLKEAGIPDGVVNMVFGYGHKAGDALVRHPDVPLISFTGSDRTGLHIAEVAGRMGKKVSLEMGGKNAAIVFEDADMDKCISALIRGSFQNQGQVCLSTSRIYVERNIFETFASKFVEETRKIKMGDPLSKGTWLGPVCSSQHLDKIKMYLALAKEEGAVVLHSGDSSDLPEDNKMGYFVAPAVLSRLPDSSRCMQEEIFGPVTCLTPFDDDLEVIRRVNGVNYGLSASLWSRDIQRVHAIAPKLEVGTIWCNCWLFRNLHMPFGGEKMSGIGREGTEDSKEFYTTKKTICVKYT